MISVLAIDDSVDDLESYSRLLHTDDGMFSFEGANSGSEAIGKLITQTPDCILLDYLLVGEDGLALLPRIAEVSPSCPVIMLTGQGTEEIAAKAIQSGAADYLVKDNIDREALIRTIELAIERWELKSLLNNQRQEQEDFLQTLVHDARTPLRNIKHLVSEVSDELGTTTNAQLTLLLEMLQSSARQLSDLVETLSTYALLDGSIEYHLVDLSKVVNEVRFSMQGAIADGNATVTIGDLPKIWGHEPQLRQLFQNLLGNAIKYNNAPNPTVDITANWIDDNHWRIEVADNGVGIPPKDAQSIFEPFRRLWTSDKYEGSGLGLAICRKIAARHDGSIWCQPEPDGGTRFFVEMNAAKYAGYSSHKDVNKTVDA